MYQNWHIWADDNRYWVGGIALRTNLCGEACDSERALQSFFVGDAFIPKLNASEPIYLLKFVGRNFEFRNAFSLDAAVGAASAEFGDEKFEAYRVSAVEGAYC
ncbi:hypothetical protein V1282_003541 [Nitrobacteraceae bacterium AZCC 2146]